jgi:hypothetical protein
VLRIFCKRLFLLQDQHLLPAFSSLLQHCPITKALPTLSVTLYRYHP